MPKIKIKTETQDELDKENENENENKTELEESDNGFEDLKEDLQEELEIEKEKRKDKKEKKLTKKEIASYFEEPLQKFINELDWSEGHLTLYKFNENSNTFSYVGEITRDNAGLKYIQQKWGGGKYVVSFSGGGQTKMSKPFFIEPLSPPSVSSPSPSLLPSSSVITASPPMQGSDPFNSFSQSVKMLQDAMQQNFLQMQNLASSMTSVIKESLSSLQQSFQQQINQLIAQNEQQKESPLVELVKAYLQANVRERGSDSDILKSFIEITQRQNEINQKQNEIRDQALEKYFQAQMKMMEENQRNIIELYKMQLKEKKEGEKESNIDTILKIFDFVKGLSPNVASTNVTENLTNLLNLLKDVIDFSRALPSEVVEKEQPSVIEKIITELPKFISTLKSFQQPQETKGVMAQLPNTTLSNPLFSQQIQNVAQIWINRLLQGAKQNIPVENFYNMYKSQLPPEYIDIIKNTETSELIQLLIRYNQEFNNPQVINWLERLKSIL